MSLTHRARERTLTRLRDGYACGTLGTGTLERRVEVALRARTADELRGLTADLPAAGGRWRQGQRTVRAWLWPEPEADPGGPLTSPLIGAGQITLGAP